MAVLFFLTFSLIILGSVSAPVLKDVRAVKNTLTSRQSLFLAEGGIEDAVYRIRRGLSIDAEETITLDGVVATIQISTPASDERDITAVGDAQDSFRTVYVRIQTGAGVDFFYGVQAGDGGIEMDSNSLIEGAGGAPGNVYSNGTVEGDTGATITGDATVAGGIAEDSVARSVICDTDQIVGQSNPEIDFAQSFTPSNTQLLARVSLYIKKVGNPGDRDVRIVTDNNGEPSGSSGEIVKGKLKSNLVGNSYGWIDITFQNPATVTQGQTYWIVFDAKKDQNKYWVWCKDSAGSYTAGAALSSEDWKNKPWSPVSGDLTFRTFFGSGATALGDITVNGTVRANTINNSTIGADAYYQSISNTTVAGIEFPGSPDVPPADMPISDANITDWKNDAGCGSQPAQGSCLHTGDFVVDDDVSIGPLTITGDLLLNQNNKTLTILGTVYVQGNIDLKEGSTLRCAGSYGTDSCLVIADGWIHSDNNADFSGSGSGGSYMMLLTTLACTGSSGTGCTHHTSAVDLHNGTQASIIYASAGQVNLHNTVSVKQITAYKIRIDNASTISYESGMASTLFSAGPGGSWQIDVWEEIE